MTAFIATVSSISVLSYSLPPVQMCFKDKRVFLAVTRNPGTSVINRTTVPFWRQNTKFQVVCPQNGTEALNGYYVVLLASLLLWPRLTVVYFTLPVHTIVLLTQHGALN